MRTVRSAEWIDIGGAVVHRDQIVAVIASEEDTADVLLKDGSGIEGGGPYDEVVAELMGLVQYSHEASNYAAPC